MTEKKEILCLKDHGEEFKAGKYYKYEIIKNIWGDTVYEIYYKKKKPVHFPIPYVWSSFESPERKRDRLISSITDDVSGK